MNNQDVPEEEAIPEPEAATIRRRAAFVRQRRRQSGRASTVNPSRTVGQSADSVQRSGGPQPARTSGRVPGGIFGTGMFR